MLYDPNRPRLLDLFSGAGGAAMGYWRAGFQPFGVDIVNQPRYPFPFVQGDALAPPFDLSTFDAIHASPPCQAYGSLNALNRSLGNAKEHPRLVELMQRLLAGRVYVIENVVGAPLASPMRLCGSSFGLPLKRHRLFESSLYLMSMPCTHGAYERRFPVGLGSFRSNAGQLSRFVEVYGHSHYAGEYDDRREAMGIDWMSNDELREAIPPAYTEFIGAQLMEYLTRTPA